ncbi:GPO family capsid scaffolding protein [Pseudomonas veronii]
MPRSLVSFWKRVATSGITADGREILPQELRDIAETYKPSKYTAVIWCEHQRAEGSFGTVYAVRLVEEGDDLEEGQIALEAQLKPNDRLLYLNDQGQKLFTSIEIWPNFAGSGKSYLTGLAVTDSPSSLGTQELYFSRRTNKATYYAASVELGSFEEEPQGEVGKLIGLLTGFFKRFAADAEPAEPTTLSAPNLLQQLAGKLVDVSDTGRPDGPQFALCLMFLATRFDQLANSLARFNALLPMPDLVRAERRARHLSTLETEKWEIPAAGTLPRWQALPLERCTVVKAAQQSMAGQIAILESYAADSSPMADLAALATRKAAQQQGRDQQVADLKALLAGGNLDSSMRARLIGPGNATELRQALLAGDAPGHEWVLCAGALLVGSEKGLSFVRELVGL